jgi:hypothetical protein
MAALLISARRLVSDDARIATMQIDRRYADYGLTGGFFLICHLALLWALGYWPTINTEALGRLLPKDAPFVGPIITGFAGALAVIAVFVVGLILDMLASLFRGMEMKIFARHLDRNSDWITAFIEAHKAYCGVDYETFRRVFRELPAPLERLKRDFTEMPRFWTREHGLRIVEEVKVRWGLGIERACGCRGAGAPCPIYNAADVNTVPDMPDGFQADVVNKHFVEE